MTSRTLVIAHTAVLVTLVGMLTGCTRPPQAAVDAVKSLKRMVSATEVGVNYQEYGSRIVDLKGDVDAALAQLPDGELKQELSLAMEAYRDALVAWTEVVQGHLLMTAREPGRTLQKKYSIPETRAFGGRGHEEMKIPDEATLSTIWAAAAKHVSRASELVGQ